MLKYRTLPRHIINGVNRPFAGLDRLKTHEFRLPDDFQARLSGIYVPDGVKFRQLRLIRDGSLVPALILHSSSIHPPFILHYVMEDEWRMNGR